MKKRIITILLVPIGIVLSLVLLELAFHLPLNINHEYFDLWIFPNRIFYLDNWDNRVYFDDVKRVDFDKIDVKKILYHYNPSYYCKEDKKGKRILFLGDSITAGLNFGGVVNEKKIFTYILEAKLNNISKNKIEVINYASDGYNILDQNTILKTEVLKCKPDLIIYSYFQNDLYPNYLSVLLPYLKYRYSKNPIYHFRTYYFFADRLYKPQELRYKDAKIVLDEMIDIANKNNISFYVINFPYIDQDYLTDNFIEEYYAENGMDYLDIRKRFLEIGLDPLTLRATPKDRYHYNYLGHKIIAEIIYGNFIENGFLNKTISN